MSSRFPDPTSVRLSPHFLLSDFLGCDSVYRFGYPNRFTTNAAKLAEAELLCHSMLEPLLAEHGPLSITYGFISPALSRQIVKYQDPNIPSFHRWDKGAAADVVVHDWVQQDGDHSAPIYLAHRIDECAPEYARMITYSESAGICVASSTDPELRNQRAFYENRYTGVAKVKPEFIKKGRNRQPPAALPAPWRGAGHPTHHGGGREQYHHRRFGRYLLLSDLLYHRELVHVGRPNRPRNDAEFIRQATAAGRLYDIVLTACRERWPGFGRFSIVGALSPVSLNPYERYSGGFRLRLVPPAFVEPAEVCQLIESLADLPELRWVSDQFRRDRREITIDGSAV